MGELAEVEEVLHGATVLAGAARETMKNDPEAADELLRHDRGEAVPMLGRLHEKLLALDGRLRSVRRPAAS